MSEQIKYINVHIRTTYIHSNEKFDFYDAYLVFSDTSGKILSESPVSKWGIPKDSDPVPDDNLEKFRKSTETAVNAILRRQQRTQFTADNEGEGA